MTEQRPGAGARDQQHRRTAARLRRLRAAGATDAELLAALDEETDTERSWRLGAEGEEALGGRLEDWGAMCGVGVLHDLVIPGSGGANIDHVVVGDAGVTVIDAKAWTGDVNIRATAVWTGCHGHRRELEGVRVQVEAVRAALAAGGLADVPVRGVLCLVNENRGCPTDELLRVHGVLVGRPSVVAAYATSGGTTGPERCRRAFVALRGAFEVRGGDRAPAAVLRGAAAPAVRDAPPSREPRHAHPAPPQRALRAVPSSDPSRPVQERGRVRRPGRSRAFTGLLLQLTAVAVGLLVMKAAISQLGAATSPTPRSSPLTREELFSWLPELGRRARTASPGAPGRPTLKTTPARFHLRYRTGACAVRISINRTTARSPADGVLVRGSRC